MNRAGGPPAAVGATLSRLVRWGTSGARRRLSILIFHRVHRSTDPLFPGEPDAVRFERTLRWVRGCFHVMPLADAIAALRRDALPAGALAITFDDGYADNATVALPVLAQLGLPATFFVATGFLDGGRMFNDTIIEAVRAHRGETLDLDALGLRRHSTADADARRRAAEAVIRQVKHLPPRARDEAVAAVAARVGQPLPDDLMMTSAQVRALADAGMEIGGHTSSHPILTRSTPADAEREIADGRDRLAAIVGRRITHFAYPNGKPNDDYDASHVALVRRLGFDAAVCTAWGAAGAGSDCFQLPRFTPWDANPLKFCLRLLRNVGRTEYAQA